MPRRRRVLFSVAALVLPLLLLGLLEAGLRMAGYGSNPGLIQPVEGYPGYIQPNEQVAKRYFSSVANLPSIPFDWLSEPRSDSTFRVVLQGGSTAAGWPYYFGADLADVVETHLNRMHPAFRFEVLNTSMAAVNSYTLLDVQPDILALEPDAVLVYAGHNEYYGAMGVGSSQGVGSNPTLIRLYMRLRPLRTVQLLQAGITSVMGIGQDDSGSAPGQTLMQSMVREQRIPLDSDLYRKGLQQFESNMDRLLARYAEAGVPVLIGTLASNLRDQAPFLSGVGNATLSEEAAAERVRLAGQALAEDRPEEALESITALVEEAPLYAAAHYVRARSLEALGRKEEAHAAYLRAKETDELRFRAPEAMNDIIRSLAQTHGAQVVDTRQALEAASSDGILGKDMMLEHLHPTVAGYRTLGAAYLMGLAGMRFGEDRGVSWTWDRAQRLSGFPTVVTAVDSLAGAYRVQQLTASWPFRPAGSRLARLDTLMTGTLAGTMGLRVYQDDITRIEALDALRVHATRRGDLAEAADLLDAVIQSYPMVGGPHLALGKIRMQQGRYAEAESLVRQELRIGNSIEAHQVLGTLLLNRGQVDAAIGHLEKAVSMNPSDQRARYNLAGAYALTKRWADARREAEEVLRRNPAAEDARRLLASLPE
ncbi:MAG: tetratricopeptide repeat protein [Bacteroidetes bacterium]|nr:tetratricopeptide repeat protein [Bacteroidota bacterium]